MRVDCGYLTGLLSDGQDFGSRLVYVLQKLHSIIFVGIIRFRSFSFSHAFIYSAAAVLQFTLKIRE
jgi:hypothetical protein